LRIPQFLIGVCFLATVQRTPGLHRRSTFQPRLPIMPATRAACRSPALPSNSTSDSHRLSDSPVGSPAHLQLAPSTSLAAQPSGRSVDSRLRLCPPDRLSVQPATCAACRSSGLPYDLPQSSRPLAHRPAPLSCRSPACAFNRPSSPAFEPNLRLIGCCILRLRLPAFLWLAPPVDIPAVPSSQLPARAFRQPSSSAFEPACDLRRLLFQAPPSCRSPACAFNQPSGPPMR